MPTLPDSDKKKRKKKSIIIIDLSLSLREMDGWETTESTDDTADVTEGEDEGAVETIFFPTKILATL